MSVLKKYPRFAGPQCDIVECVLTSTGAANPTVTANPGNAVVSAVYSATGIYTLTLREGFKANPVVHVQLGGSLGITAQPVYTSHSVSAKTITITWYTTGTTAAAPASGTVALVSIHTRSAT